MVTVGIILSARPASAAGSRPDTSTTVGEPVAWHSRNILVPSKRVRRVATVVESPQLAGQRLEVMPAEMLPPAPSASWLCGRTDRSAVTRQARGQLRSALPA